MNTLLGTSCRGREEGGGEGGRGSGREVVSNVLLIAKIHKQK